MVDFCVHLQKSQGRFLQICVQGGLRVGVGGWGCDTYLVHFKEPGVLPVTVNMTS